MKFEAYGRAGDCCVTCALRTDLETHGGNRSHSPHHAISGRCDPQSIRASPSGRVAKDHEYPTKNYRALKQRPALQPRPFGRVSNPITSDRKFPNLICGEFAHTYKAPRFSLGPVAITHSQYFPRCVHATHQLVLPIRNGPL